MSWSDCTLGDVVTLKRGHDLPNDKRVAGDVPVVSSSGFTGFHNEPKAYPPGVVTGRYGTIGEVFFVTEPYWPLNTALYAIDFHGNDPRFVAYFLRNRLRDYQSDKAAVPGVDRNVLHKLPARCPDLPTQERIAAILANYDDLIENNQRRILLLEHSAALLFDEWFSRFRFPGSKREADGNSVPENWQVGALSEVVSVVSGYPFKSESYDSSGSYGIVTIKNVQDGEFVQQFEMISSPPSNMDPECHLVEGDILLSLTGNVGRTCLVVGDNLLLNQRVAKLKPTSLSRTSFIYCLFRSERMRAQLNAISHGVAQQNLSPIKMGSLPQLIPSMCVMDKFNDVMSPLLRQLVQLKKLSQALSTARDQLLPRLMDGRIAV